MLNKSIAFRLSIYISSAVIGVFIAFIIIFYIFTNKNINENITNKAIGLSNRVIMQVEKQLMATREVTFNISEQIIFYGQHDHPELLINQVMERYPFLNAIHIHIDSGVPALIYHDYYGYRDNGIVHLEKQNEEIYHCLKEKRIFEEIALLQKPAWTEVFTCPKNKNLVISFYSPIIIQKGDKKEIVGEVICELSLLQLNEEINNLEIGNRGYAFLVSKDGTYLTHPKSDWIATKSLYNQPEKVYDKRKTDMKKVLEKGLSGTIIAYPEHRNFEKHWVYYTSIEETNWTLLFAMPHDDLFEPLYISTLSMLLISIVGILVVYFVITFLTNRLVEPLSEVTAQLKRFSRLTDLGGDSNTLDEAQLVSESLNNIKSWYKKYKIEQSEDDKKNHQQMQDLLQASEIQQGLINTAFSDFSQIEIVDIHGLYKPARIVSGDLFDFFFLDEENLLFTMGDVSGKGVPAALFMSIAQTLIKNKANYKGASKIVNKVNNELYTSNKHQFFLTLFLGIINIKTGILEYCNAAHTPAYILKQNGNIVELNRSHGLPLGLYPNKSYSNSQIIIDKGDSIVLYTDGITEMQNENKIQFGNERLVENLRHLIGYEPEKIVSRIDKSLNLFKGDAAPFDDIAMMVIKYNA